MNKHIEEAIDNFFKFFMGTFKDGLQQPRTKEEVTEFWRSALTSIAEKSDQEGYQRGVEFGRIDEAVNAKKIEDIAYQRGREDEREKINELSEALIGMYHQYCYNGHSFMSAGEMASCVIEKYNLGGLRLDVDGSIIEK